MTAIDGHCGNSGLSRGATPSTDQAPTDARTRTDRAARRAADAHVEPRRDVHGAQSFDARACRRSRSAPTVRPRDASTDHHVRAQRAGALDADGHGRRDGRASVKDTTTAIHDLWSLGKPLHHRREFTVTPCQVHYATALPFLHVYDPAVRFGGDFPGMIFAQTLAGDIIDANNSCAGGVIDADGQPRPYTRFTSYCGCTLDISAQLYGMST